MPAADSLRPASLEALQAAVRAHHRVHLQGAGTKPGLSAPAEGAALIDLSGLAGVLEYDPSEFTFTALAGTRLAEVQALLESHGQALPFDPPLVECGATLGGTVAAGLSGPGRFRLGGLRDFILGVRFVNGSGELVRGGGKVVKNAAGFDLPKFMVGSLGRYGALAELTFKVFPRPEASTTVDQTYAGLAEAVQALYRAYSARLDIDALELVPQADGRVRLLARLGGLANALSARAERIRSVLEGGEVLAGAAEAGLWREAREFAWVPAGWSLVKVPLTPRRIAEVEAHLLRMGARRRYSAGGNVAWAALPDSPHGLHEPLTGLGLAGLVVWGPPGDPRIGRKSTEGVERRIREALDPQGKFWS